VSKLRGSRLARLFMTPLCGCRGCYCGLLGLVWSANQKRRHLDAFSLFSPSPPWPNPPLAIKGGWLLFVCYVLIFLLFWTFSSILVVFLSNFEGFCPFSVVCRFVVGLLPCGSFILRSGAVGSAGNKSAVAARHCQCRISRMCGVWCMWCMACVAPC